MRGDQIIDELVAHGITFASGVPCSLLGPIFSALSSRRDIRYVGATSEGEAVAISAGAWLAGNNSAVFLQNSGLGNAINPIASLSSVYGIPALLIIGWRGQPGVKDEPQHELMGEISPHLLAALKVRTDFITEDHGEFAIRLSGAIRSIGEERKSRALLIGRGAVEGDGDTKAKQPSPQLISSEGVLFDDDRKQAKPPARHQILDLLLKIAPAEAAIVTSTGMTSRELFTLADREQHFYQVGSMGCASAIALGISLNTKARTVVIDGDGAALMKLGNFSTIGATKPSNLIHVVLDNQVHDSTGGQPTSSATCDLAMVALASSYPSVTKCNTLDGFSVAFERALGAVGPSFIRVRVTEGSLSQAGRPTIHPQDVATRFKRFLVSLA